ncbi:MAG TPA: proline/betaine transporter [Rickettsia endosymbiont of Ceroptres masudai]|nr:proline/betaine transporter [Rickettsia endosymbiont of Ceroptres masudai]
MRRPVNLLCHLVRLTTGAIKTIKNTNNFSIFNWIPWSSHGDDRGKTDLRNNNCSQ